MKRGFIAFLSPIALVAIIMACGDSSPSSPSGPSTPPATSVDPSITAPTLSSPPMGEALKELSPDLVIGNSSGGSGTRTYTFEVALDAGFQQIEVMESDVREGLGGVTRWTVPTPLVGETKYYWRARASVGSQNGAYSAVFEFRIREPFIANRPTGDLVVFDPLNTGGSVGEVVGGQFLDNGWQALTNSDYIRYQVPTMNEGMIEFETTNLSEPNPVSGKRALVIMWDPTKGEYTTNPFRMHLQKMDRNTVNFDDVRLRWISRGQEHNEGISFFDFEPDITYSWRIEWGSYPGITAQQVRVFIDNFDILRRNYDPIYHPKTHWIELGGGPRSETLEQAIWSNVRIGARAN